MRRSTLLALLVLGQLGCGGTRGAQPAADGATGPTDASLDGAASSDGGPPDAADAAVPADAALDGGVDSPVDGPAVDAPRPDAPPAGLPFPFTRPDDGTPLTPGELQTATDELIALLQDTRYYRYVDDRIHGWPRTDPQGRYWWGIWWSGVTILKQGGVVTYRHENLGADNAGLRTAPFMEGACYAYLLWQRPAELELMRRMVRGFSSWVLSMQRYPGDTGPTLMSRCFYPESVDSTEGGRNLQIDYSLNRPGVDADPSQYVHLPQNPYWGDIYIKNKRSKDDIPRMFRALAQVQYCGYWLDDEGRAELEQANALYAAWAAQVEADGWKIATLDKSAQLWQPPDELANYYTIGNIECTMPLGMRLFHAGDPGGFDCGDGFPFTEQLAWAVIKSDARQIQRHSHLAAINIALWRGRNDIALTLLGGEVNRVAADLPPSLELPGGSIPPDVAQHLLNAANAGVPLTSREIRWLHDRLHEAYVGYRDPSLAPHWKVFDPAAPDGTYVYELGPYGLFISELGSLAGTCVAPYHNPNGRPLLDCDRLRQAVVP